MLISLKYDPIFFTNHPNSTEVLGHDENQWWIDALKTLNTDNPIGTFEKHSNVPSGSVRNNNNRL
jgi:hypothetical protein